MNSGKQNIIYLHGRPWAHPMHQKLARHLGADFYYADDLIRWQNREWGSIFRFFAWIINAFHYLKFRLSEFILVDNLHISPIIAKKIGILGKGNTLVVHLASHTLYFLKEKRFNAFSTKINLWALNNYDAIICEGQMAVDIVKYLLPGKNLNIFYSFNALSKKRINDLNDIKLNLSTKNLLTITEVGGASYRLWYKGIDIMLKAFELAFLIDNELKFYIVGSFEPKLIQVYLSKINLRARENIFFMGYSNNLSEHYSNCSLFLHAARGDAFPTTTLESMHIGLPTLVSDSTGTKEIAAKVDNRFVVELNPTVISERILSYFSLNPEQKSSISNKFIDASSAYTEEKSLKNYSNIFNSLIKS
jgi:glycosyltransferase involved in cell wall biosynthesis